VRGLEFKYSGAVPAAVAPLFGFLLGVAFAWAAEGELARAQRSPWTTRSMLLSCAFGLLIHAPVAGYFLAFAADWALAYLIDSQRLPGAFELGLVLLDAASVPIGFAVAARAAAARRLGTLIKLAAPPGMVALAFVVVTLPRLGTQATYAQYHGDFGTRPVAGGSLGYALLWMLCVLCLAFAWTWRALRRFGEAAGD
jgi:hypothetical protein